MLKPAVLFTEKLTPLMEKALYDRGNQYFFGDFGGCMGNIFSNEDDTSTKRVYVSIDEKTLEILGCLEYFIWDIPLRVHNISIISFKKGGSIQFIKDIIEHFYELFIEENINSIEFTCYSGNPALMGYLSILKSGNGVISGMKRDYWKWGNRYHNLYEFEVLKRNYVTSKLYSKIKRRKEK